MYNFLRYSCFFLRISAKAQGRSSINSVRFPQVMIPFHLHSLLWSHKKTGWWFQTLV